MKISVTNYSGCNPTRVQVKYMLHVSFQYANLGIKSQCTLGTIILHFIQQRTGCYNVNIMYSSFNKQF